MVEIRKISVVSIVNKGTRFYITALKSFAYQTYKNTEWLIIDNTGANILKTKLEKYTQKDERVKIVSNRTPLDRTRVLEQAFNLATGNYIAFLNPCDFWVADKLSRQVGFMMRYKAPMSHTSYAFADDGCHLLPIGCYHIQKEFNMQNYTLKNPVSVSTLMLSKDIVVDFSKFSMTDNTDEMMYFLKTGIVSSGMSDVLTLCRPLFDKQKQIELENMITSIMRDNPNAANITSRVLEHHAHSALNVEGLNLDPMICVGYDVIASLTKLRNFKI